MRYEILKEGEHNSHILLICDPCRHQDFCAVGKMHIAMNRLYFMAMIEGANSLRVIHGISFTKPNNMQIERL